MNKRLFLAALFTLTLTLPSFAADRPSAQLIHTITTNQFAYNRLAALCDTFGPRFSGSTNLENALDWILAEMKRDGLENVHAEDVQVPHWVRGEESAELIEPRPRPLPMLGLGGSIATPPEGITAEVLVVKSLADIQAHAAEARGKIILINEPFKTYDETVRIRRLGAIEAATVGAVASLIRSVTPVSQQTPHTGNMRYTNGVPKIPHAALTVEDAEMLQRFQDRGQKIVIKLKMNAATLPDAPSRNVMAEIRGREHPEEIVIVSGHIDSWDVGQGAMDDGGGAIAAWEAVRTMKNLGLHPRRTVRIILWVNEENGGAGAKNYEQRHKSELPKTILAIESDQGAFWPTALQFTGKPAAMTAVKHIARLLKPIAPIEITGGADEADVSELVPDGVPIMDLVVDGTKYFWYHHTQADTVDKLSAKDVNACTATLAVMAYEVADAKAPLPR